MIDSASETHPRNLLKLAGVAWGMIARRSAAVVALVCGSLLVAVLQVVSLASAYPILEQLLGSGQSGPLRGIFGRILRGVGLQANLNGYVALFLLLSIASAAAYVVLSIAQSRMIRHMEAEVRLDLVDRILRSAWSALRDLNHGEFVNTVTHEAELYKVLLKNIFAFVAAALHIVLFVAAILYVNLLFGVWSGALLLGGYLAFAPLMRVALRSGSRYTAAYGEMTGTLINIARALKNVKAASLESYVMSYASPVLEAPGRVYEGQQVLEAVRVKLFELVGAGTVLLLLALGLQSLHVPLPDMLLMLVFLYRLVPKVSDAADSVHRAYVCLPSLAKIDQLSARHVPETVGPGDVPVPVSFIAFSHVHFGYGAIPVVTDLTIRFEKGEFWAVCGATGSGKTTLLDLISGIVEPSAGAIVYAGRALGDISRESLHRRVGYLTQDALIFAGSLLDNIRWGHGGVPSGSIDAAIDAAQLRDVVEEKTLAYHVAEGGQNLSGGQKQRVAIARLLAGEYDFILMDEPSSSLDSETEARMMRALASFKGKVGLIVATHRDEYLSQADYVLTLSGGRAAIEPSSAQACR